MSSPTLDLSVTHQNFTKQLHFDLSSLTLMLDQHANWLFFDWLFQKVSQAWSCFPPAPQEKMSLCLPIFLSFLFETEAPPCVLNGGGL